MSDMVVSNEDFLGNILKNETVTLVDKVAIVNEVKKVINNNLVRNEIAPFVKNIFLIGSLANGTAVKGSSDLDFFISISHDYRKESMQEIFNDLYDCLAGIYHGIRKQKFLLD